jgi:hypothetical protein
MGHSGNPSGVLLHKRVSFSSWVFMIGGIVGKKERNDAIIDVLTLMRNEIDGLPGLKKFHEGNPIYDEAIEIAKDKVFSSIEDMITYIETDDSEEDIDDEEGEE